MLTKTSVYWHWWIKPESYNSLLAWEEDDLAGLHFVSLVFLDYVVEIRHPLNMGVSDVLVLANARMDLSTDI